jgi:glycosyltransferase involved in cell wall biosynthesis
MVGFLVSIIVPCYNSEGFIVETIESLTSQTHRELQVICVNDGSTDGTEAIIKNLATGDQRIELVSKENGGIESAIKTAIDSVKGEYVFLIGHDDTLQENTIEEALKPFINDNHMDAVRPDLYFVFKDASKNFEKKGRRNLTGKEAFLATIGSWEIHTFCLWRTSIFKQIKEMDAQGTFNFDELATRYLLLQCRTVGYCGGGYNYLQHQQSVTKKISAKRFEILKTDILIRDLIINNNLYDQVAEKFEFYILGNLTALAALFFSTDILTKKDKQLSLDLLKNSYKKLNKRIVLSSMNGARKILWVARLSSFTAFMAYIQVRHLRHRPKSI